MKLTITMKCIINFIDKHNNNSSYFDRYIIFQEIFEKSLTLDIHFDEVFNLISQEQLILKLFHDTIDATAQLIRLSVA